MELLREMYDSDIGEENPKQKNSYFVRKAARIVLVNDSGQVALLNVTKDGYHKLPGGGVEEGEDIQEALCREAMEEVGAKISVVGEVGVIIEYRAQHELLQISYCYYGKVIGDIDKPQFTSIELQDGFQLVWMKLEDAIETIRNDQPTKYIGRFIQKRDLCFLLKAKELTDK